MAFAAYFQIEGMKGECTADGHIDWTELVSYSLGGANTSSVTSKSKGAGAGVGSFHSLGILKQSDKTSPELFLSCLNGHHYPKATLDVVKAGSKGNAPYMQFVFEKVFINDIQTKGSEADRSSTAESAQDDYQIESLVISFGKLTWTYKEQAEDGSLGPAISKHYDVTTSTGG